MENKKEGADKQQLQSEEGEKGLKRGVGEWLSRSRGWLIPLLTIIFLGSLILLLPYLQKFEPRLRQIPSYQCLLCHKKESGASIHPPYKMSHCTSCHKPHKKGEKSELVAPLKTLCFSCHPGIGKDITRNFVHDPVGKGFCLDCHLPHVSSHNVLLKEDSKKICFYCHRFAEELAMKDRHQPFEAGLCLSCHVAHGSDYGKGLIKNQKVLCVACHPDVGKKIQNPYVHPPIKDDKCTDCHGYHASNYPVQLWAEKIDFCFLCHRDIKDLFEKSSAHPLTKDFYCVNCHDPHGALHDNLINEQGNAFCFLCHEDIGTYYAGCAHDYVQWIAPEGSCLNCHFVHGSDYSSLLVKEAVALCKTCHILAPKHRIDHPYGVPYKDELTGGILTCSSSCHDPHNTPYPAMVTKPKDGFCLLCHQVVELP
ncbi:MAG TPA: hypothetical protein ENN38_00580 [Actinobacteria bacterium]|nr:hypothetical protein [Actinomycetota bacterium]